MAVSLGLTHFYRHAARPLTLVKHGASPLGGTTHNLAILLNRTHMAIIFECNFNEVRSVLLSHWVAERAGYLNSKVKVMCGLMPSFLRRCPVAHDSKI